MSLHNLRDAGSLVPSWVTAVLLNLVFLALYLTAEIYYEAKPDEVVSAATTAAILLSIVFAAVVMVLAIVNAKAGEVAHAISRGANTGLNLAWATTALSFLVYVGWTPVSAFVTANTTAVTIALSSSFLVLAGYVVAKPSAPKESQVHGVRDSHAMVMHSDFQHTPDQRPAFQATIADLTRLIAHQAGRAIGYAGSNILFDDSFSLELDVNARVARVYSNTNLIHTEDFLHWRLHMLLMGPAAEKVLTGRSSEVAVDDFTSFDDLAGRYLLLRNDRTFNANPINQHEAAIKASRIMFLRKNIYDRCVAACNENRAVLVDLVKLMRTRSVLTYGDIRPQLDRVRMPQGFPVAQYDDSEILNRALLDYDNHEAVAVEGSFSAESNVTVGQSATISGEDADRVAEVRTDFSAPEHSAPAHEEPDHFRMHGEQLTA